ncbi:MAG: preprotein translocase subunit YajC [Prevotella sp.]|uniref:preprotein translocase subunit YajC n=1 Tax=Prevotella sp. AGR2160 TaxID=1280674 RepID=UPI00048B548C|nr:preprotein translocase subunit YajC [Prevotella sp. AGR2160]MDD5862244.1 preprotein translocase subunit YajC [Prevotella sp.]
MNTMILSAQAAQQGGGLGFLVMMVAIFVIMWLFMVRPQQKKQKKIREFQNAIKAGDQVVTGGGIYGTVRFIDQARNTVDLEVAHGVTIKVDRGYIFQSTDAAAATTAQK